MLPGELRRPGPSGLNSAVPQMLLKVLGFITRINGRTDTTQQRRTIQAGNFIKVKVHCQDVRVRERESERALSTLAVGSLYFMDCC